MISPVWFVTGCSSGFGSEIARAVLRRGWRVVVTARTLSDIDNADFVRENPTTALPLKLDVTRSDEIAAAVERARSAFGRIDVLVNNAGYGYIASTEEGSIEEVRALFDVNFFGLLEVTQAVLPIMRAQGSGTIVNMSSSGGLVSQAGNAFYNATKYAVEGLSEALAEEIAPLRLRVLIVEPGAFRTKWHFRAMKTGRPAGDAYKNTVGARQAAFAGRIGNQPGDPERGAEAIISALAAESPPLRLVLGARALSRVRAKTKRLEQEMDAWEEVSLGTDQPSPETSTI